MRDIGANIRRARTRRHLTQDDLAQTVHTTRQTISNYETGRPPPSAGRHCAGCASRGPSHSC